MNKINTFVYKNSLGDSTNNGLSSKHNSLTLVYGPDIDIMELDNDDLVLTEFEHAGVKSLRAVPVSLIKEDRWYMFGGNFIYTSDSRFPSNQPIGVFDRVED